MLALEIAIVILLIAVIVLLIAFRPKPQENLRDELDRLRRENAQSAMDNREELSRKISQFQNAVSEQMGQISQLQAVQFGEIAKNNQAAVQQLTAAVETRMENIRKTVDQSLNQTLQTRIGESFQTVSQRLEVVHKGLGEMQTLAQGVGDLKKVLTNVKTRGIFGEIQLGNLLEEVLSPSQYEREAHIGNSRDHVEFAVKIPQGEGGSLLLPIDSKFPLDVYTRLVEAYEAGEPEAITAAGKELEAAIKKSAKDIKTKYIDPTVTVDFGILFLPVEGLYSEVARRPGLLEQLQKERVVVAGPTTLTALIFSLQVGFKTLAIQKRSSEVWEVLAGVKREFANFEQVLADVQRKMTNANNDLDKLITTRTKKIIASLKSVEEIPAEGEDNT